MNRLNTVHYRDVRSNHIGWLGPDTQRVQERRRRMELYRYLQCPEQGGLLQHALVTGGVVPRRSGVMLVCVVCLQCPGQEVTSVL